MYNREEVIFLFFGFASEYSLGPLYQYMSQHHRCIEIDCAEKADPWKQLSEIKESGKKIVFFSSDGFLHHKRNICFAYYNLFDKELISVLEAITYLDPILSVYYPHDLVDPIKKAEIPYLGVFDLCLWPFEEYAEIKAHVNTVSVGWIKYKKKEQELNFSNLSKIVWFMGATGIYSMLPSEVFYNKYQALFDFGVGFKLHNWPNTENLENYLKDKKVSLYDKKLNSIDIMVENEVIITHASSSIVVEASLLGKKIVYFEDFFDSCDPRTKFNMFPDIVYTNLESIIGVLKGLSREEGKCRLKPFDFERAELEILRALWSKI